MGDKEQWYSNKDLFELIGELQNEMRETRTMIKRYNGLYEKVDLVKRKIEQMEAEKQGKKKVEEGIRQWGGWIFAGVTLLILLYNTFLS